jgi:heme/copper-type cytochrome/quinol oxidase subunit 4
LRVIVIVVRVLVFFTLLGTMLVLLSLGYDVASAVSALLMIVCIAVQATVRLVGDPHMRSSDWRWAGSNAGQAA